MTFKHRGTALDHEEAKERAEAERGAWRCLLCDPPTTSVTRPSVMDANEGDATVRLMRPSASMSPVCPAMRDTAKMGRPEGSAAAAGATGHESEPSH